MEERAILSMGNPKPTSSEDLRERRLSDHDANCRVYVGVFSIIKGCHVISLLPVSSIWGELKENGNGVDRTNKGGPVS